MTMSVFLLLLFKVNLAMGAAIILVSLIRRPLRAQFGAPIAYAIWLLVPIASVASLLPPREVPAPAHVASVYAPAAPAPVTGYVPHSTLSAIEQLAPHSVIMPPTPVKPLGSSYELFDVSRLLFAAWVLGLLFMGAYLTGMQIRFSAAVRRGQAGPAVLGFFRPRIVTPSGFHEQFTPQEQAAILVHERVHLARQDARINALVALLRCVCWFNPFIHLGTRWLRIDQEMACDAIAVSDGISRRDYSMALLKSQVMVGVLPFGCNWPGPQHPLVERIALLQRKPPGSARRHAGAVLVLLTAISAGLGAWAAQPPVTAKAMAAEHPSMAPVRLAAIIPAQDQTARNAGSGQAVAPAHPTGTSNDVAVSKDVSASRAISEASVAQATAAPNSATTTDAQASAASPTDSIAAQPMPKAVSAPELSVASSEPPAAPILPPPNAAPAVAFNDQHLGQPTTRDMSVKAGLSTPPAFDPHEPYEISSCTGTVTGRVTSPTVIQAQGISCVAFNSTFPLPRGWGGVTKGGPEGFMFNFGRACKGGPRTLWAAMEYLTAPSCPSHAMTVELENPADASKMPLGKLVRVKGDFRFIVQNKIVYLLMQNTRVL
jgi:beta-lactamase regulating signal transducer with metallopeptidase domain